MNKRQFEAQERAKLKHMLEMNPKLEEVIGNMVKLDNGMEGPNPELAQKIAETIKPMLKRARADGFNIGMIGSALIAMNHIKDMQSIDEVKEYFQKQEEDARKRMNLPKVEIDDILDDVNE